VPERERERERMRKRGGEKERWEERDQRSQLILFTFLGKCVREETRERVREREKKILETRDPGSYPFLFWGIHVYERKSVCVCV